MPTTTDLELTQQRRALKREACEILGIDPTKVRLRRLTNAHAALHGRGLYGFADVSILTIYTKGRTGLITYVHELLHLLYRTKPHWWVFGAAYILAGAPRRAIHISVISGAIVRTPKARLQERARAQARKRGLA